MYLGTVNLKLEVLLSTHKKPNQSKRFGDECTSFSKFLSKHYFENTLPSSL